ncbi:MAG: luciferase family protein [Anaerolineales bacterium]
MTGSQSIERIIAALGRWEDVECRQHRYRSTDVFLGLAEVARVHANGVLDLRYNQPLAQALIAEGKATPHEMYPDSGWVNFHVHCERHVPQALWLLEVAYCYHRIRWLNRRAPLSIEQEGALRGQLQTLNLSARVAPLFEDVLRA